MQNTERPEAKNTQVVLAETPTLHDRRMTNPRFLQQWWQEEQIFAGFDQALSDRCQGRHLLRACSQSLDEQPSASATQTAASSTTPIRSDAVSRWPFFLSHTPQPGIILICLALLLLMIGFDLMGILVLCVHLR